MPINLPTIPSIAVFLCSALLAFGCFGALSFQRFDVSRCRLVQQILQSASVVQAALNLRHKLFRHVDGNTTSIRPTVQDITLMLFARLARRAILADAPATPQAQRTEKRRPKIRRFTLQPVRDIKRRFRINMLHIKHVIFYTCMPQEKSQAKLARKPLI